jgi:peptidoglycan L-alanyl-D-glutamate endopeptidase CwlK
MYYYSKKSKAALNSAHPDLQKLFNEVIKIHDCTIIFGKRTLEEQQKLFAQGRTIPGKIVTNCDGINKKSKHQDGLAVDVAPYFGKENLKIDWSDREKFVHFAGIVKGVASQLGIKMRWGGDWDSDNELHDQTWMDLPHYELL